MSNRPETSDFNSDKAAVPRSRIKISISGSSGLDQSKAAARLSDALHQLNIPHAYIGGFAWALLGSTRPTQISLVTILEE
jgi:hypothetical protein